MSQPLFDPNLYHALRKVARGQIATTLDKRALKHRTETLPAGVVSALHRLCQDGYVSLGAAEIHSRDGWAPAELTLTGTQLLTGWMLRAEHEQTAA